MKKLWSLLGLVLALVLLIGGYLYVKNRPQENNNTTDLVEEKQEQILKLEKDKIIKMVLISKNGEVVIDKKDDKWTVSGTTAKLDQDKIEDIASSFSTMFAEQTIEENPKDLEKYGLKDPVVTAKAVLQGGEEKVVYLGNKTPLGNTYYLMVKDVNKVYAVWMNHGENFSSTVDDLKSKQLANEVDITLVTDLKLVPSEGRTIEITTNKQADAGQEFGINIYNMVKPYSTPRSIDTEKFEEVIKLIPEIQIKDIVEDDAKDLSKYGLSKPKLEFYVKDKNNKTLHLFFGSDLDETTTYFKTADSNAVYTIEKEKIKPIVEVDPFSMISKFTAIVNIEDVDRIEIKSKDKTYNITLTRTLTKKAEKEGEEDEYTTTYKINDKTIKEEDFKKYYQTLIGLIADAENDKNLPNNPEVTTTYYLNKGEQRELRVDYSPYNNDFYVAFKNGTSEFLISRDKVNKMLSETEAKIK